MNPTDLSRKATTSGAQTVVKELLQQPVKEAVREALREEARIVRPADTDVATGRSGNRSTSQSSDAAGRTDAAAERERRETEDGGRSRLLWGGVLLGALAGGVYLLGRRKPARHGGANWTEKPDGDSARGTERTLGTDPGESETATVERDDGDQSNATSSVSTDR